MSTHPWFLQTPLTIRRHCTHTHSAIGQEMESAAGRHYLTITMCHLETHMECFVSVHTLMFFYKQPSLYVVVVPTPIAVAQDFRNKTGMATPTTYSEYENDSAS